MNFLPLILFFLLFKSMSGAGGRNEKKSSDLSGSTGKNGGIFDNLENAQQALQLMSTFNKIRDNKGDMGEVLGEIMSNPMAMNIVSNLMNNDSAEKQSDSSTSDVGADACENRDDFSSSKSAPAQHDSVTPTDMHAKTDVSGEKTDDGLTDTLFSPVEKIAGVELTRQLKKYYENWYVV